MKKKTQKPTTQKTEHNLSVNKTKPRNKVAAVPKQGESLLLHTQSSDQKSDRRSHMPKSKVNK